MEKKEIQEAQKEIAGDDTLLTHKASSPTSAKKSNSGPDRQYVAFLSKGDPSKNPRVKSGDQDKKPATKKKDSAKKNKM